MSTIMEALGGNSGETIMEVLGGSKGETISEVIEEKEIIINDNPLTALAMDFDISDSVDLLGKVASDLQSNMAVNSVGEVTGTSKYVTDYTGFSSNPEEQQGNYVAFHISVGDMVIGTNVTVKVNGVTLDPDGIFVMIFREGTTHPKAIAEASADGHKTISKVFDFTHVVKEPAENESEEETVETIYTVSYNANGGTGTIESVEVEAGNSITLNDGSDLTPPENKQFAGWAKSASAKSPTVESPFIPDKDTELFAVWGDA